MTNDITYNPHAIAMYRTYVRQHYNCDAIPQRDQQTALLRELIDRLEEQEEKPLTSITFAYDHELNGTTIPANV